MTAAAFTTMTYMDTFGSCYKCGIEFAAPANYVKQRRDDSADFYRPNGHPQRYTKGRVEILEAQLAEEKRKREWAEKGRETARRAEAIASGKLKAIKHRVKNGVCPCCHRSFENLQRHMTTKHPDFATTAEDHIKK
jgi:hypothetical protein